MKKVSDIVRYGKLWLSEVNLQVKTDISSIARQCSNMINDELDLLNIGYISVRKGFGRNLMVYHRGKARKYSEMLSLFETDKKFALWIYKFLNEDIILTDFSDDAFTKEEKETLQTFVIIVCLAEVGRSYTRSYECVRDFAANVYNGNRRWSDFFSAFPAATTYREDEKSLWLPKS